MGYMSDYYEGKILGHAICGETWTPLTTFYAALYTAAPDKTGGGTEAAAGAYARKPCTFVRSGSSAANVADIEFPVSSSEHGSIPAIGLFDALTGGNFCAFDAIDPVRTYNTGESITIPAGQFTFTYTLPEPE